MLEDCFQSLLMRYFITFDNEAGIIEDRTSWSITNF